MLVAKTRDMVSSLHQGGESAVVTIVIPDDVTGTFERSSDTDRLRQVARVEVHGERATSPQELARRVTDAEVILSFRPAFTRFPATVLDSAERLRFICMAGTGVEDIDMKRATERGIPVANVVGSSNRAVAEHGLALMFDVARRVTAQDRAVRSGLWKSQEGVELGGRILGIVGLSAIGRELSAMAAALGMRVLSWSRDNDPARARAVGAEAVSLETLLAQADFVSLHIRLFPELAGFFDARRFAQMKQGAFFINTARGELIVDEALRDALLSGHLAGAGLDVFAQQPLPETHPFRDLANVVLNPATGWNTSEASQRMIAQAVDNVLAFLAGHPINIVNPAALDSRVHQGEPT